MGMKMILFKTLETESSDVRLTCRNQQLHHGQLLTFRGLKCHKPIQAEPVAQHIGQRVPTQRIKRWHSKKRKGLLIDYLKRGWERFQYPSMHSEVLLSVSFTWYHMLSILNACVSLLTGTLKHCSQTAVGKYLVILSSWDCFDKP